MRRVASYDSAYRDHAKYVWAIVYRMTGSAADADDIVQDTFVKVMQSGTAQRKELRAWLGRIAINASIDMLRARRRRGYVGSWLPEPVETAEVTDAPSLEETEHRYDLLESASMAFLMSLEALSPRARAVLLLRDVFDYSVAEVAQVLGMTETHVKVTHHRARLLLAEYDRDRRPAAREETARMMAILMSKMAAGDIAGIEALLADDARALNDSAGEYHAARVPIVGRKKVAKFWGTLARLYPEAEVRLLDVNGAPAVLVTLTSPPPNISPHTLIFVHVAESGRIDAVHGIVANRKLARLLAEG